MSDIFNTISIIVNILSIVLALIGLFFVIRNWRVWRKIGLDIIKAKAFLNKEFLEWNWVCIVVVGALIIIRRLFRFHELMTGETISPELKVIFDILGFFVILLLVLIAYQWYKLIHDHK